MKLIHSLILLFSLLSARQAVYVKGHSHAANEVREKIAAQTCFKLGDSPDSSNAILQVDHLIANSGRHWVVLILLGRGDKVLYEKKAEEYPWPFPSPIDHLLKGLANSTCSRFETEFAGESLPPPGPTNSKKRSR